MSNSCNALNYSLPGTEPRPPALQVYSLLSIQVCLNQIPYDCTVEVINRFKGLDLVDRVLEELWTEVRNTVQKKMTKHHPPK